MPADPTIRDCDGSEYCPAVQHIPGCFNGPPPDPEPEPVEPSLKDLLERRVAEHDQGEYFNGDHYCCNECDRMTRVSDFVPFEGCDERRWAESLLVRVGVIAKTLRAALETTDVVVASDGPAVVSLTIDESCRRMGVALEDALHQLEGEGADAR